jgi:gliding motility-associated-like protein
LQLAKNDPTCYHGPNGKAFGTAAGGMGNFTYRWNTTPVQTGDTAFALLQGDYTLTVMDANGCTLDKTISVIEPPEVTVSITPGIDSLKFGKSVGLTSTYQNTTATNPVYSWEPADGLSCIDCPAPIATPLVTTTYTLTFTDDNGCQASAKTTLNVDTDHPLYIPNAFSPNGDDKNDLFYIYGSGIKSIDLKIFDRWGEEVFATQDPAQGWNGYYKGSLMTPGIFVYVAKVIYVDDAERDAKGSITLLR